MTKWELHVSEWKNCTRCVYSKTRKNVVLARGHIPCDVLFVGEGPGPSEDELGKPFIGKAGKLLDRIVHKVFGPERDRKYKVSFDNIIGCIPLVMDEDGGHHHEKEEPDHDCVVLCAPRLEEFIHIAQPKLVIAVGKVSDEWLDKTWTR